MAIALSTAFTLLINALVFSKISSLEFTEKYFNVYLDHFDQTQGETFPIRYLISTDYWRVDGPLFFYTGNEGDITAFAENSRFLWEIAKKFNACLVFAEHRYYGNSTPQYVKHIKNELMYLSSEQALQDYIYLISHISINILMQNVPVICFGGSYGGMLAAWIRIKYPNIVQGSLAASAPLLYFYEDVPCNTFMKIVSDNYKNISLNCFEKIKGSWALIDKYFNSENNLKNLSHMFELCDQIKPNENLIFKSWLQDIYVSMTMANYPYPANFLAPMPGWPVKLACSYIDSEPNINILKLIFKAISIYTNYTGDKICNDLKSPNTKLYRPPINKNKLGYENWYLQTCEEMVMPFCSNGLTDMFEKTSWNYENYCENCKNVFNIRPRKFWLDLYYGSKNMKASNIIFSNGLLDPWSGGGILNSLSDSIVSIIIPEGAHHLDLRGSSPLDPESVIKARNLETFYIKKWIDGFKANSINI